MPSQSELTNLASQAREQRLAGDYHNGDSHDYPLIGYCFDNAYVCWHVLNDNGINARIIEGTTERVADELVVEGIDLDSIETTDELTGLVHYWVEVDDGETTWIIDIASEGIDSFDECLVTDSRPDDYYVFSDSREGGEQSLQYHLETQKRCSVCGGMKYDVGGCSVCSDFSPEDIE